MSNLSQLLSRYMGTSLLAPIAIGVKASNQKLSHISRFDCHCSTDDCDDCYNCHCSSDDCDDCYDCHCGTDDC